MQIREISEKRVWEEFFWKVKEKSFLNSWEWGEFQKEMGEKVWRFGLFEGEKLLAVALAIKIEAKRGTFLYLPHCPVFAENSKEGLQYFFEELKDFAKKQGCDFLRTNPLLEKNAENQAFFQKLGFKRAPLHIHPEMTFELDIKKSEEELLAQMRKTTRYLIRQAQKNCAIEIQENNSLEALELFYSLYALTAQRHSFVPFSFDYLKKEFLTFSKENQIFILLGKYQKEAVAGGIFILWQKICFYHHGASSQRYAKIPVSYLLLWEAIKKAKERGCERFNFWGGVKLEEKNKKHPWYGLSLFKAGFGAKEKEYLETQDLILTPKYWLNFLVEKLRKWKRRY